MRESPRYVIGIGRALVVLEVTTHARIAGQVVVTVDVAIAALQFRVPSGQRETAFGMIEGRRLPG